MNPSNKPGMHALIVGIGNYLHLPPEPQNPQDAKGYKMNKLKTPALSAFDLFKFLCFPGEGRELTLQLSSCRLMLDPCPEEAVELQKDSLFLQLSKNGQVHLDCGVTLTVELRQGPVQVRSFRDVATAWREDAEQHKGGITLFYFAGHGLAHNYDRALLLSEFNRKGDPLLDNAISSNALIDGMYGSKHNVPMAQSQYYFFDCCSTYQTSEELEKNLNDPQNPFSDRLNMPREGRAIARFFASRLGSSAWEDENRTLFSKAVLEGLKRGADGRYCGMNPDRWDIATYSMTKVMKHEMLKLYGQTQVIQDVVTGSTNIRPILTVPQLKDVDVWVILPQLNALEKSSLELRSIILKTPTGSKGPPLSPNYFFGRIPMGNYTAHANFGGAYPNWDSPSREVKPPVDSFFHDKADPFSWQ